MALNKTILTKLAEKTAGDRELQDFLCDIFQFESTPKTGWYDRKYNDLLEKYCKEEEP